MKKIFCISFLFALFALATSCSYSGDIPLDRIWVDVVEIDSASQTYIVAPRRDLRFVKHLKEPFARFTHIEILSMSTVMSTTEPKYAQSFTLKLKDETSIVITAKVWKDNAPYVYEWTKFDENCKQTNQFLAVPEKDKDKFVKDKERFPDVDLSFLPTKMLVGKRWINDPGSQIDIHFTTTNGIYAKTNTIGRGVDIWNENIVVYQNSPSSQKIWGWMFDDFLTIDQIEENGETLYVFTHPTNHSNPSYGLQTDTMVACPPDFDVSEFASKPLTNSLQGLKIVPPLYTTSLLEIQKRFLENDELSANVLLNDDLSVYLNETMHSFEQAKRVYNIERNYESLVSTDLYPTYKLTYTIYETGEGMDLGTIYNLLITYQLDGMEELDGQKIKSPRRLLINSSFGVPSDTRLRSFKVDGNSDDPIIGFNGQSTRYTYPEHLESNLLNSCGRMELVFDFDGWIQDDNGDDKEYQELLIMKYDRAYDTNLHTSHNAISEFNNNTWLLHSLTSDGKELPVEWGKKDLKNNALFYPFEISRRPEINYPY